MKPIKCIKYLLCAIFAVFFVSSHISESKLTFANKSIALNSKRAIKTKIIKEAKKQGLHPALAISVAKQESNFEKSARSHAGAIGLFQLMPATARELGVNPRKPEQNIRGGIKYLKDMKRQFGSTRLALAAYNAGPGAVRKYGGVPPYRETRNYVRNIMRSYRYYSKHPDAMMRE